MKKKKYLAKNLKETKKIAEKIIEEMAKNGINLLLLEGELGAGKTALAGEVLSILGAKGPFTSPTFVVIKKYDLKSILKKNYFEGINSVYHLDCYRVSKNDIIDLGWNEIITDKKNLVLVEWPEKIRDLWPEKYLRVKLESIGENSRKIETLTEEVC